MKKTDIRSREDAVTKDMQPEAEKEQLFNIPGLGVSVKAMTMNEALIKAKEVIKANK
jgi:hypothetical protein